MIKINKQSIVAFFLLVLFFSVNIEAEEFSGIITGIEVTGLKRTKKEYVEFLLSDFIGSSAATLNKTDVETVLRNSGLFSEMLIDTKEENDGNCILLLTVEEKLTILPLPFASFSDGVFLGGGFFMDSNAFGLGQTFLAGGYYSPENWGAISLFGGRFLNKKFPAITVSLTIGDSKTKILDRYYQEALYFKAFGLGSSLTISKNLISDLSLGLSIDYSWWHPSTDGFKENHFFKPTLSLSWSHALWNGWYMVTSSARTSGSITFPVIGSISESVKLSGQYQHAFFERLLASLSVSGTWTNDKSPISFSSASNVGVSIMKKDFASKMMAGAIAGLECGIVKNKSLIFTGYTNYQLLLAEDYYQSRFINHGCGFGIKMYLQKLAVPALSAGITYNVNMNALEFTAAIGMSF